MLRWNALGTKDKVRVARVLYRGVAAVRRAFRRPMVVHAVRRGVTYELDLAEGIDLAMYLFGTFEPDTYRALRRLVSACRPRTGHRRASAPRRPRR